MKKGIKRIILFSLVMLTLPLQAQHLQFMGIPLTGNIDNFSKKLSERHVLPIPSENRTLGFGIRAFYGYFAERKCKIYVWYDRYKNVYSAKTYFYFSEEDYNRPREVRHNFAKILLENLKMKYSSATESKFADGDRYATLYVPRTGSEDYLGEIILWWKDDYSDHGCDLNLQYVDYASGHISNDKIKDDL